MKSILRKRRPRFLGLSIILATVVLVSGCAGSHHRKDRTLDNAQFQTDTPCRALPIHATFLDEISWDIPHQNWGVHEWDRDFHAMKDMGIGTVVMIRSGLGPWLAAPFENVMSARDDCFYPPVDLVELFLTLADKYGMDFYFGTYDSGQWWHEGEYQKEIDVNIRLIDEVWARYGHHPSFKGWYLSQEVSRRTKNISAIFAGMGFYVHLDFGLNIAIFCENSSRSEQPSV